MDPLTHALVGAATGYALFGRRLGRRAAAVGALAAIAPDVDHFVSSKTDVLLYVEVHRAFTHSFVFSILGSLIVALPWMWVPRFRKQWGLFWLCAWPAYLTHCLLDASTTYGTQLLWPWSRERFGWDLIAVIDPVFTLTLGLALFVSLRRSRLLFARLALAFALAWLAAGGLQKNRAFALQQQLARTRGHTIERSEVMPTLGNNLVWRSLYLADGQLHSDRIRVGWSGQRSVREGTSVPLVTHDSLSEVEREANQATRAFDRFAWFSQGWVARSPLVPDAIADTRYSLSTKAFDPIWAIRMSRDGSGFKVEWINRQLQRDFRMRELLDEIFGRHPDYKPI